MMYFISDVAASLQTKAVCPQNAASSFFVFKFQTRTDLSPEPDIAYLLSLLIIKLYIDDS